MILHIQDVQAGITSNPCLNKNQLLADDPHIGFNPFAVWNAAALSCAAFSGWGAPEPDIIELFIPVGGTAGIGQQFIARARGWNSRNRAKPGREVTL